MSQSYIVSANSVWVLNKCRNALETGMMLKNNYSGHFTSLTEPSSHHTTVYLPSFNNKHSIPKASPL